MSLANLFKKWEDKKVMCENIVPVINGRINSCHDIIRVYRFMNRVSDLVIILNTIIMRIAVLSLWTWPFRSG